MKWLLLFLIPAGLFAQHPPDEDSPGYQEMMDTLSLNNIKPQFLWSMFQLEKEAVFNFFEYRNAYGYFVHVEELYFIEGIDTLIVNRILSALPLNGFNVPKNAALLKAQFRHSASSWSANSSLIFNEKNLSGALHTNTGFQTRDHFGYIETKTFLRKVRIRTIFGDYAMSSGQGLLLGRTSFPNAITSEYFANDLRGMTGNSSIGFNRGVAVECRWSKYRWYFGNTNKDQFQSALMLNTDWGSAGLVLNHGQLSIHGKRFFATTRLFAELNTSSQLVGWNKYFNDLLIEVRMARKDRKVSVSTYMNWQDKRGSWNFRLIENKLKVQWSNKNSSIQYSQHKDPTKNLITSRWRYRQVLRIGTMDLHVHAKTYGVSLMRSFTKEGLTCSWYTAFVKYDNHPVWISTPVTSGNIGALGVFEDYAGAGVKLRKGQLQCSTQWNALNPKGLRFQFRWQRYLFK